MKNMIHNLHTECFHYTHRSAEIKIRKNRSFTKIFKVQFLRSNIKIDKNEFHGLY